MAVDTRSLVYLIDPFWQGENINGKPLVGGYMEVYVAGTDTKYITWSDWDGARHPFRIPLKSDGRACILVEPQYTYDCYLYDSFGNLACSRLNVSPDIGGDVSVSGLTQVYHDETISGNGTPQEPLSVVSAGKVYEGIEPIVVNNVEDKISAQHVPLGVQDPLYFVQDDEEGCIIGFSGQTIPEGVMSESALGFENNKITGYNGSAFSAGNEYEAGSYVDITDNTISVTGLPNSADVQNIVDVATSGLMPSGDYLTKESADTLYAPTGNYLTGLPEDLVYSADITGLATTAQLDEKLDKSDSANFYPMNSNPSGYINELPSDLATTGWVDSQGYLTAVDIPESATWNATTQTVSVNSAAWAGGTANPQIPVTGINGIKISESADKVVFEVSGDYYPGNNPSGFITGVDLSDYATTAQVSEKLDTTAFSDVSGDFLTAVDLTPYQTTAGMTAYQPVGDYMTTADSANFYTTANESGYLTAVPDTYLQNTDLTITDGKVTEISGVPLSAGDELPSGVMNTSALEYNAVNEISGYNGSAIAQYGAEKQWLVHDDTLVHASNSAQYALGVNLSAVAQLLGVDETVLWEGTDPLDQSCLVNGTRETATLSEPLSSFNRIRIYAVWNPWSGNFTGCNTFEYPGTNNKGGYIMNDCTNQGFIAGGSWSANETTFKLVKHWQANYPAAKETSNGLGGIFKIVGIGRKQ